MDNLAHALTSVATTAVLQPDLLKRHFKKAVIFSMIFANLPDIDFALHGLGQVNYHFHHRGLTHSVFGLPILLFLALLILKYFWPTLQKEIGTRRVCFWILAQIILSHFLLDYLTSYGVMFLYPASFARFASPLMFIIDPMYWTLNLIGCVLIYWAYRTYGQVRTFGFTTVALVLGWWATISYFKSKAQELSYDSVSAKAYPGPLAPLSWLVVDRESASYRSSLVSFFALTTPRVIPQVIDPSMVHDKICDNLSNSPAAVEAYHRYQDWATETLCSEQDKHNCVCHSVRYAFNLTEQKPYFGTVNIHSSGNIAFIPPDSASAVDNFVTQFISFEPQVPSQD